MRRDLKNFTERQRQFYAWLVQYFQSRDPQGLIYDSIPPEEYAPEAREIVAYLPIAKSVDDLTDKMHALFSYFFTTELAGSRSEYVEMARTIFERWESGTP